MAKPLLLNLIDTCLAALPQEAKGKDFYWDWGKRLTGINKKHDNGYSLLGDWISKENQQAWQRPGLYFFYAHRYIDLPASASKNRREQRHLVSIFELNDEGIATLIHMATYEKGDYAVQCWNIIDRWLFDHPQLKPKEQKKQQTQQLEPESPLTVDSAIALAAPHTPIVEKQPESSPQNQKASLRDLMIRFAIEAQFNRGDRVMPLDRVNLVMVVTKTFPWGEERLFDVYRVELARAIGIDWRLLPEVKQEQDWLVFHFSSEEA